MKTHLEHIYSSLDDKIYAPIHMTLDDLALTHARSLLLREKITADGKPAIGCTRMLTARKRIWQEVMANYTKTRINIGY